MLRDVLLKASAGVEDVLSVGVPLAQVGRDDKVGVGGKSVGSVGVVEMPGVLGCSDEVRRLSFGESGVGVERSDVLSLVAKEQSVTVECVGAVVPAVGESDSVVSDESFVSWSDEVNSAEEGKVAESSGSVRTRGFDTSAVAGGRGEGRRDDVRFGGAVDAVGYSVDIQASEEGFYRSYVRVDRVRQLERLLLQITGVKIPKKAREELALVTYTAGTVPVAFKNGQMRLKALAAVGDAAMTSVLVDDYYVRGADVASVQALRSGVLSNTFMAQSFVKSGLFRHVSAPAGVDVGRAKTGADAVEAIAGVLHMWRDSQAVRKYMTWLQMLQ